MLTGFGELIASAPDELTAQSGVISTPDGTPVLFIRPTWSGSPDEGGHWITQLGKLGQPVMSSSAVVPYGDPLRQGDEMFVPDGRHYAIRTRNLASLTAEAAAAIAAAGAARTSPLSAISMHHFHGAATRIPLEATAFGLRREHFMVEILASWRSGDGTAHRLWADETADLLRPFALPGGYPNLLTTDHAEQVAHAFGQNAGRLMSLKQALDPDGSFTAIPLPPPR